MATLSLYKGSTEIVNLLTGNLQMRAMSEWVAKGGTFSDVLQDSMGLVGRAASDAALLGTIYDIQDFLVNARNYVENPSRSDPCWLRYQPDGASAAMQSLVFGGELLLPAEGRMTSLLGMTGKGFAELNLDRWPFWEAITGATASTTGVSILGGKWAPSIATIGDRSSRISKIVAYGHASDQLDNYWMGVRPIYQGTSSFTAKWEAESGTAGTDTSSTADASASGGSKMRTTFATNANMAQRIKVSVDQIVGSNYNHFIGDYLVIGRVKMSDGTTRAQLRLFQGLSTGLVTPTGDMAVGLNVTDGVTSYYAADWQMVELGSLRIPPMGYRIQGGSGVADSYCRDTTIYLYAQRTAGSGYLDVDCFLLVPREPIVTIKNAALLGASDFTTVETTPAGDIQGSIFDNNTSNYGLVYSGSSGPMLWPKDGGIIVLVAEQTAAGKLTTTVNMEIGTYPRYSLIRE